MSRPVGAVPSRWRESLLVLAALLALAALAWGYLAWLAVQMGGGSASQSNLADMPDMPDMPGMPRAGQGPALLAPSFAAWTPAHVGYVFAMWAVMMVGMMTPTVAPMVLTYARVMRPAAGARFTPASFFAAGYLTGWIGFAFLAALAQCALEAAALLTPAMMGAGNRLGGAVLVGAGIYQWLPAKDACLAQCRSPLSFLQRHGGFRSEWQGSLRLGFLHGLYCIGCCWALMAVLFVVGVMNLLWVAALMGFVLLEKLLPGGRLLSRVAGAGLLLAGVRLWAL